MFDGYYYHGTDSRVWSELEQNPDFIKKMTTDYLNYTRWLAPNGIYFFYENILQAIRFAEIKADYAQRKYKDENIEPVVLKTKLKKNCKALTLFTSDGLQELWSGHRDYLVNSTENLINAKTAKQEHKEYFADLEANITIFTGVPIEEASVNVDNYIKDIYRKKHENGVNIESRVISALCQEKRYDIVIGAIQENITFNKRIHNLPPKTPQTNDNCKFRGFGFHDHIEVCVLNPNIILQLEKCEPLDDQLYKPIFYKEATSS